MSKVKYWAFTVGAVLSALSGAVVVWKGFTENIGTWRQRRFIW